MKKIIKITVGVVCILLGLAALFTPLTPGSWLIPIGLELLGLRLLLANKLRAWIDARPHSKVARVLRRCLCLRRRGFARKNCKEKVSVANSVVPPVTGNPPRDARPAHPQHAGESAGRSDRPQRLD